MQAADAMDSFVSGVTASGDRRHLSEAIGVARESISLREAACGQGCAELADSLEAYEALRWRFEDYREALPLAERALEVRIRTSGPHSPEVAHSTYVLAEAHRALRNFATSESLHRRAAEIWAAAGGHELDLANSLHYQGLLRWTMGDLSGARRLMEKALAMRQAAGDGESDGAAAEANTLGSLAAALGDRAAAMSWFERGGAIWERTLGKDHPHVARSLVNQAHLLAASGEESAARELYRRALRIRLNAFGGEHYLVARSLADLGRLAFQSGDFPDAGRLFGRALEILRKDRRAAKGERATVMVDDAKLALATGDATRALTLSLSAEAMAREEFLRTSRDLPEEDALRYETVRSRGLDVALTALCSGRSAGAPGRMPAASRAWDEVIRSRAMVLDEMAARRRGTARPREGRPGLAQIARRLPGGSALVAFVRFTTPIEPSAGEAPRYLAFVARAGGRDPVVVSLGSAREIDRNIREWLHEAGRDPRLAPHHDGEMRTLEAGRRLRRSLWDPVVARLGKPRIVFVVPDGAVSFVSFAALPEEDDRFVLERAPSVPYLSAERDLVLEAGRRRGTGVLAVGDVDYDSPSPSDPGGDSRHSDPPVCGAFETLRFEPLPGTRGETDDLRALWKTAGGLLALTGAGAQEGRFKTSAPGRRILHLATHGFFLQDRCPSFITAGLLTEGGVAVGDHPLLLSGLALAGANRRGENPGAGDDGMLTAEEIASLDLTGTEWVVLSACETGVGQVLDGEGVLGLRRAFHVAGAATLITTLWPVDDRAARVWVRTLYEGRFRGLSTVESLRRASLRMLDAQRAAGRSTHPYSWGAFVAAGDWR